MSATGWTKRRPGSLRDARGYTLVEVSVGVAIALVVGLGLYQVFIASQRSSTTQRLRNEVQSSCTFAMDQIKSELALGGYRAVDPVQPISVAAPGSITFEYWDDRAEPLAGHSNNTRVTYRLATTAETGGGPQGIKPGDLVRESTRYETTLGVFDTLTKQVLAEHVPSLAFTYLQTDNAVWNGISLGAIRTVRTSLTCTAGRASPGTNQTLQVTLTSEVRARNVGVSATPQDTTPPATPTGVVVWDEGKCGELQVRWDGNIDADLEGYIVYTGLSSGILLQAHPADALPQGDHRPLRVLHPHRPDLRQDHGPHRQPDAVLRRGAGLRQGREHEPGDLDPRRRQPDAEQADRVRRGRERLRLDDQPAAPRRPGARRGGDGRRRQQHHAHVDAAVGRRTGGVPALSRHHRGIRAGRRQQPDRRRDEDRRVRRHLGRRRQQAGPGREARRV